MGSSQEKLDAMMKAKDNIDDIATLAQDMALEVDLEILRNFMNYIFLLALESVKWME